MVYLSTLYHQKRKSKLLLFAKSKGLCLIVQKVCKYNIYTFSII